MAETITLRSLASEALDNKIDWMEESACIPHGPKLWFSAKDSDIAKAKAICSRCPVQPQCLELALLTGERWGVWGGLDEKERWKMWKRILNGAPEKKWTAEASTRLSDEINRIVDKDVTAKQKTDR